MKPLPIRTSLALAYTGVLALILTTLGFAYHSVVVRQLDGDATDSLAAKARGLHGYLQFENGSPVLTYDRTDPEETAFVNDATRFYQVYDANTGRLLTQSPGMDSVGLQYTHAEVAEFSARLEPHDVQTDGGRLRLLSTVITPKPGEAYLVQIGESLNTIDKALAGFDRLVWLRIVGGILVAALIGRWLAGHALTPLARLATEATAIDIGNLQGRLAVRGANDELDQVANAFNHALARVDQSVGEMRQFSAALAHELRTPIAILRGEAELELAHPLSADERSERLVSQIDEYDRLTRLISQILTLARADAGEIRIATEPVALGHLASTVAEQIEPVAEARSISLTCEVAQEVSVQGDAGWLERLLLILLDNALKYTPDLGRVSVQVSRIGGEALLTVTDSGIGISAEALPHLFERFYRAASARSQQTQGAGLGLALAKWIAERHGATIDVTSHLGEGSAFVIRLRAIQPASLPQPVVAPSEPHEPQAVH